MNFQLVNDIITGVRLEHYSVEKLKKEISEIVYKYLNKNEYNIFFFGSRVNGRGTEYSDIDVGINGNNIVKPEIMRKIKDDIEEIHTMYIIDIVDFATVSTAFKNVAMKNIEYING